MRFGQSLQRRRKSTILSVLSVLPHVRWRLNFNSPFREWLVKWRMPVVPVVLFQLCCGSAVCECRLSLFLHLHFKHVLQISACALIVHFKLGPKSDWPLRIDRRQLLAFQRAGKPLFFREKSPFAKVLPVYLVLLDLSSVLPHYISLLLHGQVWVQQNTLVL